MGKVGREARTQEDSCSKQRCSYPGEAPGQSTAQSQPWLRPGALPGLSPLTLTLDPGPKLDKRPLSLLPRCPAQPRTIQRQALAQPGAGADPGFIPELRGTPGGLPGTSLGMATPLEALSPDGPVLPE